MTSNPTLLAVVAAAFLVAAPARAVHPFKPPAPEFPDDASWFNAKPLRLGELRDRRAVLAAFINTANLNSLRAVKILNQWWDAYSVKGLLIVGVHSAEHAYQKRPELLRREIRRLGIAFPVVSDDSRKLWKSYGNEGWPSFYLIDHKGRIIYDQIGEGRYEELERELRQAMENAGYEGPFPEVASDPPSKDCGPATPELVVAPDRVAEGPARQIDTGMLLAARDGELARRGRWEPAGDGLRLADKNLPLSAFLRVIYRGAQSFAVLAPAATSRPTKFFVRQDDFWLHSGNAGGDIQFDDDGRSYVEAGQPRLYWLTQNADDHPHGLTVSPAQPGAAIHALSFADRCLKYAP